MSQVYLINQASFIPYQDISSNVKPARLNTFIKKAQDLDLRLILGDNLFYDFLKNCEPNGLLRQDAPPQYASLLNGCEYSDHQGQTTVYDGLTSTIVYFTLSRFIESDNIRYTSNGPVIKGGELSEHLSYADIIKVAQQYRSIANAYANNIESFLSVNHADFPLWRFDESAKIARQPGARIRGIDRTDFNYPAVDTFSNLYNLTDEQR